MTRRACSAGRPTLVLLAIAVAATTLLIVAGCGGAADDGGTEGIDGGTEGGADTGSAETGSAALDGTDWRLVRWRESALDPADFTITASFADGGISGTSAVNTYSGSYTTGGVNDFSVGDLASTMMAGPEPDMEAEAAFTRLLEDAASFHATDTTLTLFGSDGAESLIFTAGIEE
ncbi:MAG: META domain-containing protein [Thermoleophilia bacterium]|nr:META domain-containing protein [Thermoleophilia bacterium]